MILTTCFFAFCIIHILYWLFLFAKIRYAQASSESAPNKKVSVVVVFKNELENLKILVPKLLDQTHPNYEIVLCDDYSTDDSYKYVNNLDSAQIKLTRATIDAPGKKLALKEAIALASGEIILLTDADCYPASKNWIKSMSTQLIDKQIVLGYSPHLKSIGWLNKFIRFETYLTALQYFSYALVGMPYMGVGRNLLYQKSLFVDSAALDQSSKLTSGDDDIFVNAVSNRSNTHINLDPKSFVHTYPSKTLSAFLRQKRRHVTTATVYKLHHQLLLAMYAISHIMIYILFTLGLVLGNTVPALVGFLVVMIMKWFIAKRTMTLLNCGDLSRFFPVLDFLMVLYYMLLTPATFFKTKNW